MNKLKGLRCYLAGAIDRAPDLGITWRQEITPALQRMGVVVYDPMNKPVNDGLEDSFHRQRRVEAKKNGIYEVVEGEVREIRRIDKKLVTRSDFIICYVTTDIFMCGTFEELCWANDQDKPILIFCKQGIKGIPDWLFGQLNPSLFFDNQKQVIEYLSIVDQDLEACCGRSCDRWVFFDY